MTASNVGGRGRGRRTFRPTVFWLKAAPSPTEELSNVNHGTLLLPKSHTCVLQVIRFVVYLLAGCVRKIVLKKKVDFGLGGGWR